MTQRKDPLDAIGRELAGGDANLTDRTARFLAGELPGEPMPTMSQVPPITFRVRDLETKTALEERADRIAERQQRETVGRVTRSDVYREAFMLGLAELERREGER